MKMNKKNNLHAALLTLLLLTGACNIPKITQKNASRKMPEAYLGNKDTLNSARTKWRSFFTDSNLIALIDTALINNQELNIMLQEITVSKNEAKARKGEYLPFLKLGGGAGIEKVGRYTSQGASDANTQVMPGKEFPDPLPDYLGAARFSWEIDIWKKLRNARKSAIHRYLASIDGRNFMVTNLVAEIANSYYELLALDNQLEILNNNIAIQQNALEIVKLEKNSARVTELAVRKFEAEVFKNQSHVYYLKQSIIETENRINFLVGRFPQTVTRSTTRLLDLVQDTTYEGIPSQVMENRPDVLKAGEELTAAGLDVKVAKAAFYPSLSISAVGGFQSFNPQYFLTVPQSVLYNTAGELMGPVINRYAIKAAYSTANAKQIQAAFQFERTLLNAHIEVYNQLNNISNLKSSFDFKSKQVEALTRSIEISTVLFRSARADYMEVLMTQRDALDARFDLVETKLMQMQARVNMYKALGGGWQ